MRASENVCFENRPSPTATIFNNVPTTNVTGLHVTGVHYDGHIDANQSIYCHVTMIIYDQIGKHLIT